jgi:hypothetical protein
MREGVRLRPERVYLVNLNMDDGSLEVW